MRWVFGLYRLRRVIRFGLSIWESSKVFSALLFGRLPDLTFLAYPEQLRRILTSSCIQKVGIGILNDIVVVWNDLRSELQGLLDAGMMARLLLCDRYTDGAFNNLSLADCAADVLGFRVDKGEQVSDWTQTLTVDQIRYAGTDAIVALRLYERLVVELEVRATRLGTNIPIGWYGFNSRMGEPTRTKKTIRGEVVPWSTKDCPWFFSGKFQGYYP
ncbi:ribonuclease H-like domain-containing protein [Mycena metata]|uniref:Ribonuclease H-like domain-containing protein n=1 Tax=Mycena metata TaxID=1033252 RepID=A0AAD7K198_9AGAR|nr:ribonuclease H-like domain-containing protein [Mycena metata]